MTTSMKSFVRARSRDASPAPGPPQPSSRAERGARAKVHIFGQGLKGQPQPQQGPGQNVQPGSNVGRVVSPLQGLNVGDAHGQRHEGDRYDTDADSLDTSTMHGSAIHVSNRQQYAQQQGSNQEPGQSGSEDEEESGDENDEDMTENEDDYHGEPEPTGGFFGGGNSYPSTTSGPPEDFNNWNAEIKQEMTRDVKQLESTKPHLGQDFWNRNNRQPLHQHKSPNLIAQTTSKPSVFQQGKTLRQNMGAGAVASASGNEHKTNPRPEAQMSTYTQAGREPAPRTGTVRYAPPEAKTLPERGLRSVRGPLVPSAQTSAPVLYQAPTNQTTEAPFAEQESKLFQVEDYDLPTLYKMSYERLRDEEFDDAPRGLPQVLSEDMQKKPLSDRMRHVHEKLGEEDKVKFVHSLPLHEWEDAGQWFVDRFSEIMKRTIQARQTKRKLAKEFENEVEKRYRHVEKRQRNVEDALNTMQAQGETIVLPRTPRASREPRNV